MFLYDAKKKILRPLFLIFFLVGLRVVISIKRLSYYIPGDMLFFTFF